MMVWLLKFLVLGHIHKWETETQVPLSSPSTGELGRRYYLRCKCCGDVAKRDLI